MSIDSDYRALERDEMRYTSRFARPYWFSPSAPACEHMKADVANAKQIETAEGFSDGLYCLYACKVCGSHFSTYLEG
jgi:hypothetical protein